MKTLKKLITASLFLLFGLSANAATWHTGYIRTIYPLSNGNFVITFMEPVTTCSVTQDNPYLYAIVGSNGLTVEGSSKIYSAAMASAAMGKRFSVNFNEADTNCSINRGYMRVGID